MDGPLSLEEMLADAESEDFGGAEPSQDAQVFLTPNSATPTQAAQTEARASLPRPLSSLENQTATGSARGSKKRKLYAVKKGRKPGLYETWGEAQAQVEGFRGAVYKSFQERDQAEAFLRREDVGRGGGGGEQRWWDPQWRNAKLAEIRANRSPPEVIDLEEEDEDDFKDRPPARNRPGGARRERAAPRDQDTIVNFGGIGDEEGTALLHKFGLVQRGGASAGAKRVRGGSEGGGKGGIRLHAGKGKAEAGSRAVPGSLKHMKADPSSGDGAAAAGASSSGRRAEDEGLARPAASPAGERENPVTLSPEQERAIREVLSGRNVFITGGAGVGKSFLVKLVVEALNKRNLKVQICASTGIAALHIQGQTIHSFSSIPIHKESKESIAENVYKQRSKRDRWRNVQVLLIDEISMVSPDLFDTLDFIAKRCRGTEVNGRPLLQKDPMGGVQVIAVGDFFQLPPAEGSQNFVFDSAAWKSLNFANVVLERVWRQSDPTFVNMLNEIRVGNPSPEAVRRLQACSRPLSQQDGIIPTKLYPLNKSVDGENKRFFDRLEGQIRPYECKDFVSSQKARPYLSQLDKIGVPTILETKPRMQVMLRTNIDIKRGLCNGTRGVILGYRPFKVWLQGNDEKDLSRRYAGGVAHLKQWGKAHPQLPFVLFSNGVKLTIAPAEFERKFLQGKVSCTRLQIPLNPAWAITIHKAQGMSLDRVQINLSNSFGAGMAYVALSRATSLQGLQLEGFSARSVIASKKVRQFYSEITKENQGMQERAEAGQAGGSHAGGSAPEDPTCLSEEAKGKAAKVKAEGEGPNPWSSHLEDHVYDAVSVCLQSALTQAMGSGVYRLEEVGDAFKRTCGRACDDVLAELRMKLMGYAPAEPKKPKKPKEATAGLAERPSAVETKPTGAADSDTEDYGQGDDGRENGDATQRY